MTLTELHVVCHIMFRPIDQDCSCSHCWNIANDMAKRLSKEFPNYANDIRDFLSQHFKNWVKGGVDENEKEKTSTNTASSGGTCPTG